MTAVMPEGVALARDLVGPAMESAIARLTPAKRWWEGEAIDPYPILMERGVMLTKRASAPQPLASGPD